MILLTISAAFTFGAVLALNKVIYKDAKNEGECDATKLCTTAKCCVIWQSGMCRKGEINDENQCVSKADVVPAILLTISIGFFIAFIVYLVKAIRQK